MPRPGSARRNLQRAASEMLSMPTTRAFIDQHRDGPDTASMLVIDTGDGREKSEEDMRCDGCRTVSDEGLSLTIERLRVTAEGLESVGMTTLLSPFPVVMLVFGICDRCAAELGAAA